MSMPVCSHWADGNAVGYAMTGWWSDVAVERGDDGYGKRWKPFLAVVYDVVDYYCHLLGPPMSTGSISA